MEFKAQTLRERKVGTRKEEKGKKREREGEKEKERDKHGAKSCVVWSEGLVVASRGCQHLCYTVFFDLVLIILLHFLSIITLVPRY